MTTQAQISEFWDCETIRWCKMRQQNEDVSLFHLWHSFEIPQDLRTVESLTYLAQQLDISVSADDADFKPALLSVQEAMNA